MKLDKLKLKAELQSCFENSSIRDINIYIKLCKIMKFLYTESTIFCITLIPTLSVIIYYFLRNTVEVGASIGFLCLLTHFIIYKTLIKGVLFKDNSEYEEFKYTIEVLEEIKNNKLK